MYAARCGSWGLCRSWVLAVVVLVVGSGSALAQTDRVFVNGGPSISGKVVSVSSQTVDIEDSKGETRKVPIEQIREVAFAGEPTSLKSARGMVLKGRPADAIEELKKIEAGDMEGVEPLVVAEKAFVEAAAVGGVAAMTGADLDAGTKAVQDYLAKHGKSHHALPMQELLGNILTKAGKFEDAATAYGALEKGPPAFRVRAASARANLFFAQEKFAEAIKEFDAATKIETDPKDVASAAQKSEAELGKARCMARQGKSEDAVKLVQGILKAADPEAKELLGRAYNVLGESYRAAGGKDQDALIAFLTVDLVYNTVPDNHAEALFNLVDLWERGKNPERAREARQQLESAYPQSPWTKKLGAAKPS